MRTCSLAFFGVVLSASLAHASISVVSESRQVFALATATNASGTSTDGPFTVLPVSPGSLWNTSNSAGATVSRIGAGAAASAIQVSGWTITSQLDLNAQGSVSTSTNVTPTAGGISAQATARSIFDVTFSIPANTSIAFQGSSSGIGVMRLENADTQAVLHSGSGFYNAVLGPMNLRVYAAAIADNIAPVGTSFGGGYSFLLTAVPSPAAGLWIGAAALMIRRRR